MSGTPHPVALRDEARRLREQGLTYVQIGERLGVAKATVGVWIVGPPKRTPTPRQRAKRTPTVRKHKVPPWTQKILAERREQIQQDVRSGELRIRQVGDLSEGEARRLGIDRFHYVQRSGGAPCDLDGLPAVCRRLWPKLEHRCAGCVIDDQLEPTSAGLRSEHHFWSETA